MAYLLNLTPTSKGVFVKRMGLEDEMVPWVLHPWIIIDEEVKTQNNQLRGVVSLAKDCGVRVDISEKISWLLF